MNVAILVLVDYPFGEKGEIKGLNKKIVVVAILVLVDYPFGENEIMKTKNVKFFVAILVLVDYPFGASQRGGSTWPPLMSQSLF